MRHRILTALVVLTTSLASAQDLKMRDVFKQIPDSLMPYLTQNNRLDFIDFLDSNMKAEVSNLTGGTSEMTALTDDSLSVRMSDALQVDMVLLTLDEPLDAISQLVVVSETFLVDSIYGETVCHTYTSDWQPVTGDIPLNEAQKKRQERLNLQNILKWKEDKLKNR
ncbi:MAG: DUF3256 family protein [Prevotella sp.]|nr:DUF3256 family protein [Prevotella sp.]